MTNKINCKQRRTFLKASLAASSLALLPFGSVHGHSKTAALSISKSPPAGLQLYTVRNLMQAKVSDTLKLAAKIGYTELEFAGYFEQRATDIRNILDTEGLTAPSAHVMLDAFERSSNQVIDDALTIGHRFIVIPYLNEQQRGKDIESYERIAEKLNIIGETCKKAGLHLAYHNHAFEFEMRQGQLPYDVLLQQTDKELVAMEMDLYWMAKAKIDPIVYFKQYPGRFPLWHVKDMDIQGNFANVGQGIIDFRRIFDQASLAGFKHGFVERDQSDDPLQSIQQSYKGLMALQA